MALVTLHLRSETKPLEHRSALTPTVTRKLLDKGFKVNVERSAERIFDDEDFATAGATLVEEGSWPNAPEDHIIIGLKDIPTSPLAIAMFKNQGDWKEVLGRFPRGGGTLYDLEFLADEKGRRWVNPACSQALSLDKADTSYLLRVAAFGFHAGYAGAALALLDWAWQLEHGNKEALPSIGYYQHKSDLDAVVKEQVSQGLQKNKGKPPRVLVIGALGRCGRGALECCRQAGIPEEQILKWDMDETARPGPYDAIKEADVFINCIYLSDPIPPFISTEFLKQGTRNLSVV
ncbi:Saccharopine dehydrogenase [Puttea exsequens]|nr:Saccharopine dehydrogenase [Puttea exsequens]